MMMTNRLKTLTDLVPPGKGVIDVGTDHGYVPVELALRGYQGNIIASDVNPLPLSSAKRFAREQNVSSRISFRLSDGLSACAHAEADTVIIAGMGGDLICRIIDECEWVNQTEVTLILQPMTKSEILRYYLVNNGFVITDETLVRENGRIFRILVSRYNGVFWNAGLRDSTGLPARDPYTDAELFCGRLRLLRDLPEFGELLEGTVKTISKKLSGFEKSERRKTGIGGNGESDDPDYRLYASILRDLKEMEKML